MAELAGNVLFYGDNLDVLRRHVPDESVDLVYLDPPFNSNRGYNIIFAQRDTHDSDDAAQIQAFDDTSKLSACLRLDDQSPGVVQSVQKHAASKELVHSLSRTCKMTVIVDDQHAARAQPRPQMLKLVLGGLIPVRV